MNLWILPLKNAQVASQTLPSVIIIEPSIPAVYKQRLKLLCSVPRIGTLIVMEFLVELSEMGRSTRADELPSYIALTPSELSTGGMCVREGSPVVGTSGAGHVSCRETGY